MNETENASSSEDQVAALDARNLQKTPSFRIRTAAHKLMPWLIEHPFISEARAYHKKRDPEENERTAPPADEFIDLRGLWVVEFYTPAHIENLLSGFRRLGWDKDDDSIPRNNPLVWVQRLRENPYGGGWLNLGHIRPPGSRTFLTNFRSGPLPPEVEYATGRLFSLTSSLTCIVMGFVFNAEYSRIFDSQLRVDRETYLKRKGRGHQIFNPAAQKEDHIRLIRAEAGENAASWFRKYIPGLFSSGILGGDFPTCEFVSLRATEPFPARPANSDRPPAYLSILDMDDDWSTWTCADMSGLKFTWPTTRGEDSRYHAVLAVREGDLAGNALKSWNVSDRSGQINYLDHLITGLLSRWAILPMLTGYGRHLNAIRNSATLRSDPGHDPVEILRNLVDHVSYNVDVAAVTAELIPYANEPSLFDHEVETFRPSNAKRYGEADYTLAKGLRIQIGERAVWLQKTDQSLRDHLTQYGTLLGATESIRVQRTLRRLTIVVIILTLLMLWAAMANSELGLRLDQYFKAFSLR